MRSTPHHELKTLLLSFHPVVTVETSEEERVLGLARAVAREQMMQCYEWSVTHGLRSSIQPDGLPGTNEPRKLLKHLASVDNSAVYVLLDFAKHLSDPTINRQFREVAQFFTRVRSTMLLCGEPLEIPADLRYLAVSLDLPLPTRQELRATIDQVLELLRRTQRIEVRLDAAQLDAMARALAGLTIGQARQLVAYVALEDGVLGADDLRRILKRKAQVVGGGSVLEFLPAEDNATRIGGFAGLKSWLKRAAVGFSAEARALNLGHPRGALIVGVQGCGKSLAAKAIAREWGMPLLKLDAGRLYDKFIGESERNFRTAIATAESMAPAVLWIDEIEKAMGGGGGSESDGGLGRRLFGSFLTWLQENRREVFVVATANDLALLPPELLRKGRFDEVFFVDLPEEAERHEIIAIHLGLRRQDPETFDLGRLVGASAGFSGAEIEQAVVAALYRALHLGRGLDDELLLAELRYVIPLSVSRREDVDRLRAIARDRFVPVA